MTGRGDPDAPGIQERMATGAEIGAATARRDERLSAPGSRRWVTLSWLSEQLHRSGHASYHRDIRLAWRGVALVLLADVLWLPVSKFRFAPSSPFWLSLGSAAGLAVCYAVFRAVCNRLRGDPSTIAAAIRVVCERAALAVHALTFQIALFAALLVFSYLSASLAWPLQDELLAASDQWLGFDWVGFLTLTNSNILIAKVLVGAYKSSGVQLLLLYLFLSLGGHRSRLAESFALLTITALMTLVINLLVPAAGAYAYYSPARGAFTHFSEAAGMWHYDLLLQLRVDPTPLLDFERLEGLVTFPSFHTVLAILTAYSTRRVKYLFGPVAILNALVIISTIPEGGHHLVDVLAGAAIAFSAIALLRFQLIRARYLQSMRKR